MLIIALFGFLMMILSLIMIIKPKSFADGIVKFAEKSWFHPFEIISRLAFGLAFVYFADETLYPRLMTIIGCGLILVGAGLLFTPPSKHRKFALWSAESFKNYFRWFGFASLAFGAFLLFAVFGGRTV